MKILTIFLPALFTLIAALPSNAQRNRPAAEAQAPADDQVLMLEEIRIQVAPELPTVVVTIPRQRPNIQSAALKKNPNDLVKTSPSSVKPRLADLQVNRIEEPHKMLAKDRSQ